MSINLRCGIAIACFTFGSGICVASDAEHTGTCGVPTTAEELVSAAAPAEASGSEAPASEASAPAPKAMEIALAPTASADRASDAPAAPAPKPPKAKAWWPGHSDGKLNILDVRSGEFSKTIVVSTDGTFQSTETAASAIQVSSADGQSTSNQWTIGANKKTLLLPVKPGRYTVKIGTQLADASGKAVAKDSSGTVEVR